MKNNIFYSSFNQHRFHLNPIMNILFIKYFNQTFWKFFKLRFKYKFSLKLTTNLTKSITFWNYKFFLNLLNNKCLYELEYSNLNKGLVAYSKTVNILEFPFQYKLYNSFIFFILFFLTSSYYSFKNDFNLYYSFILKPSSFNIFFFLNRFYFVSLNY